MRRVILGIVYSKEHNDHYVTDDFGNLVSTLDSLNVTSILANFA